MEPERFLALKRKVDQLQRKADESAGSLKTLMSQLQSDHGVKTLAEAESLLKKLRAEEVKLDKAASKLLATWEEKFGKKL